MVNFCHCAVINLVGLKNRHSVLQSSNDGPNCRAQERERAAARAAEEAKRAEAEAKSQGRHPRQAGGRELVSWKMPSMKSSALDLAIRQNSWSYGRSPSYSGWAGNGGSHALQVDAYVCGDTHFWRRAGTCRRRRSRTSTIGACFSTAVTPGDQYQSLIGEMKKGQRRPALFTA